MSVFPAATRGFQRVEPAGTTGGPWEEGGGVPAKPPSPPPLFRRPLLIHPLPGTPPLLPFQCVAQAGRPPSIPPPPSTQHPPGLTTLGVGAGGPDHILPRPPGKESLWLLEAPVRNMILQMHTPARTCQCWSRQTHGLGVCIWMPLVNGTGNSPVSGTADPRSSPTGQVIRGLC